MKRGLLMWSGFGLILLVVWLGAVALSSASTPVQTDADQPNAKMNDGGVGAVDGGVGDSGDGTSPDDNGTTADPASGVGKSSAMVQDETVTKNAKSEPDKVLKKGWRRDKSIPRRPGSYIGGSTGAGLGYAWFQTTHRELVLPYELKRMVGSALAIRVGDAFFEWLTVGFQINIFSATRGAADDPKTAAFALLLDTAFYPWRGLGLKPSVGLGFSYGQAGTESFQISMGGPATLAFGVSYEFRVSRFFTMGPTVQVSWTTGEDYDAFYLMFALEFLKWFKTAEG